MPRTGYPTSITLSHELRKRLTAHAKRDGRTMSGMIAHILSQWLARSKRGKAAADLPDHDQLGPEENPDGEEAQVQGRESREEDHSEARPDAQEGEVKED